jgi:hypothetical protein
MYLPLSSTAEKDYTERFMSFVQLVFSVHYGGPSSEARSYSVVKALGEIEYQGQMCQAVLVFITWEETDGELVKQKSFKATFGTPDPRGFQATKCLGMEEQNCKFWCIFLVEVKELGLQSIGQFETLEYFGPPPDVVVVEEKRTCTIM